MGSVPFCSVFDAIADQSIANPTNGLIEFACASAMCMAWATRTPPRAHNNSADNTTKTTMPETINKPNAANEKDLTLVRLARAGNIDAVKGILEAASPRLSNPDDDLDVASKDPHIILPSVINEAGVWQDIVERDYENVYSWYGVSCAEQTIRALALLLGLLAYSSRVDDWIFADHISSTVVSFSISSHIS